jgi:hypothetical protein
MSTARRTANALLPKAKKEKPDHILMRGSSKYYYYYKTIIQGFHLPFRILSEATTSLSHYYLAMPEQGTVSYYVGLSI